MMPTFVTTTAAALLSFSLISISSAAPSDWDHLFKRKAIAEEHFEAKFANLLEARQASIVCPGSNGQIYTATGGKTFQIECSNDHAGGDLSMVYATTLSQCIESCASTTGCVAFSWVSQSNGANNPCYLKSTIGANQVNAGVMGGKLVTGASTSTTSVSSSTARSTTSSITSSGTASATAGWQNLGCYSDSVNARTLAVGMAVAGGAANMTVENCQSACKAAGYSIAGLEYSSECYCDNSFKNGGGPASDGNAQCTMTCNGNQNQLCGGANRLNVYRYSSGGVSTSSTSSRTSTGTTSRASTTSGTSTATVLPAGWSYYGCWIDNANGRILPAVNDVSTQTIESCIATCAGLGHAAAGLEYSTQCYCGDAIYGGGKLATSDTECNMPCGGNSKEICGAGNRMSIYSTKALPQYQPPKAQTTGLPTGWSYAGCVTDDANNRTLEYQTIFDTTNSAVVCTTLCQKYGFMSAGLEYSNQCFCGDASYKAASSSVAAPESDCNALCPGDPTFTCGAGNRINYYVYNATAPLWKFNYPTGTAAGEYNFLIGGVVIPLMTTQGVNGKIAFVEKHGTGPPNSTGAYELDVSLVSQGIPAAWRTMNGLKTDVFCSAGLVLPDKAGRQINIGGWSGDSTYGVRLYWPDGSPGQTSVNDWQENQLKVSLQKGRWYPTAMMMANGSILVVGGQDGSNGAPVPSLEIMPNPAGGKFITLDFLQRTDPYNLYPFLYVLPSGGIFISYFNEARIMDPVTFATIKVLPNIPCHVTNPIGGRTYPFEGTSMMMPQKAPYTELVTILLCGGSTPDNQALDNCVSIQPDAANPQWVLERMPSKRVMPCITALPDGTYLIANGAHSGQAGFGLATDPNHNAVLYDPTKPVGSRMSIMGNTTIDRLYHSEAILLQDGRVLISGSDPETEGYIQEYRVEVFRPPYLLSGRAKPTFTMSSKDWKYGASVTFAVTAPNGGPISVSLMGAESSTHGNSMGQRTIIPAVTCTGGACTVVAPPNANVCPPGWFQVFVLDGPTPSVSQYVRIGGDPASLGNWPNFPDFKLPGI